MMILSIYEIFPQWMEVHNIPTLIALIFVAILGSLLYLAIGYGFCPLWVKTRIGRCIVIVLWPVYIALVFIMLPLLFLYKVTTPKTNI